ncbi:semaphorin-4G isoform X6 [Ictalurus furcatus]|uniref:semaphorin-4G isoform X6 n=1 Tax=Ictalurus furcatus TaxID=66913 RepID=UPI00235033E6|nr:semaphorin-4G isoform X6 [Ictalurus furcatus]XP_053476982.1 semaphorin-4G isoform X6 [Ictalurus furcatus]
MRMRSNVAWLSCLQLLCAVSTLTAYPVTPPLDLDVTPRTTVLFSELWGCQRFSGSALNYSTLLLEEEPGLLYVGARGALYALQASNISSSSYTIDWEAPADQKKLCQSQAKDNKTECFNHIRFLQRFNSTHLYTCGTHAFKPQCAYIDSKEFKMSSMFEEGRERCPYDPAKGYTGLLIDGQMYTASQYEFWSSPDIRRNSPNPMLRTEEAPTRWLYEADFVESALVKESVNSSVGDDDKIYFFFTEKSQEHSLYSSYSRVARVARVCKSDRGGRLTLQKKWTSFLKARLVCSLPDYEFHFNVLRSMFVLEGPRTEDTMLYGIFGLEWKNVKASAICRYSIKDVQQVFEGPYMENQEDAGAKLTEYTGKVPDPRPGSCITDRLRERGINLSTDLPDDVLHFVRRHPLMSRQIPPLGQRPLLFRRTVDYTKIVVHRVTALDGQTYNMLFIGTDEGWLQRAVEVKDQLHIIEELQLFEEPQPVDSIVISQKQMSVYVGSPSGVVQLPLSTCHRYASCFDCVLARDPFCAWDGVECVEITSRTDRSNLTQDILNGNEGCAKPAADDLVLHRIRSVMAGDDVLLQCELSSNLATPQWTRNKQQLQGYGLNSGYRIGTDGLLVIEARPEQSGNYSCFALENGVRIHVVIHTLIVHQYLPPPPHSTLQPKNPNGSNPSPQLPYPLPPQFQSMRNMEAMYISLITIFAGLCLVLTVVLLYVGFCVSKRGKYSLRAAAQTDRKRNRNERMELKTVSSNCNGKANTHDGLLQIVPGEAQVSSPKELLPAPPLPPPLPNSELDYTNGFSATLPSVLRKMNGNSYVLLRQTDGDATSPLYHSFTEELNRILEKRKHTQLCSKPDESSV